MCKDVFKHVIKMYVLYNKNARKCFRHSNKMITKMKMKNEYIYISSHYKRRVNLIFKKNQVYHFQIKSCSKPFKFLINQYYLSCLHVGTKFFRSLFCVSKLYDIKINVETQLERKMNTKKC